MQPARMCHASPLRAVACGRAGRAGSCCDLTVILHCVHNARRLYAGGQSEGLGVHTERVVAVASLCRMVTTARHLSHLDAPGRQLEAVRRLPCPACTQHPTIGIGDTGTLSGSVTVVCDMPRYPAALRC